MDFPDRLQTQIIVIKVGRYDTLFILGVKYEPQLLNDKTNKDSFFQISSSEQKVSQNEPAPSERERNLSSPHFSMPGARFPQIG